ncbi:MAG: hypothetical protein E6G94_09160 [Alphaproteobacteria bacterium]|nr:MAG: hypothetical protein E6G94_09160 [Alphaproteobacteria bacterium]
MLRRTSMLAAIAVLAACNAAPENIQDKAENTSRALENKAAVIGAEAENSVDAASETLENQAAALQQEIDGNAPATNASDDASNATTNKN